MVVVFRCFGFKALPKICRVRVQAENGVGVGQLSAPLLATTLPPPPLPPSLSLVSCTHTSLRVAWGKKASKSISYTLQIASDSGRYVQTYVLYVYVNTDGKILMELVANFTEPKWWEATFIH